MCDADVGGRAPSKCRDKVRADARGETTPFVWRIVLVGARTGDEVGGRVGGGGWIWGLGTIRGVLLWGGADTRRPCIVCTRA